MFLSLDPDTKRQKINNLYEAVQLFQVSKFKGIIDNVRVLEEETTTLWAFHKNGFDAVRTNEGCYAANSNWLVYMLHNRYDEIGCFGICEADGNGHITNYIKNGEWYYFIDMMMQRYDSVKDTAVESGNIDDYKNNIMPTYIYKAKSFDDFIKFILHISEPLPVVFYKTKRECVCIGNQYRWEKNENIMTYNLVQESTKRLFPIDSATVLFSENDDAYELRTSKAIEPNWATIGSFDFKKRAHISSLSDQ
ncbi:MAG: hypothetical protein FWC92_08680 [Defluviitaleaceae bacterium]|nr:hypothetical protein [Defluviitaleaceae bacterium]